MQREMEKHDRERQKEEERLSRERQREELRFQREQRRELERQEKLLQKENLRVSWGRYLSREGHIILVLLQIFKEVHFLHFRLRN